MSYINNPFASKIGLSRGGLSKSSNVNFPIM